MIEQFGAWFIDLSRVACVEYRETRHLYSQEIDRVLTLYLVQLTAPVTLTGQAAEQCRARLQELVHAHT